MPKKLIRITTVPISLEKLLESRLTYMSRHYEVTAVAVEKERLDKYGRNNGVNTFWVEMTRAITPVQDLKAVWRLYNFFKAEKPDMKLELKSLVFPKNQYNSEYFKTCEESGINTIRTNPSNWYWQNTQKDSLSQKVFRTGDAYFGLQDKTYKNSHLFNFSTNITGQNISRLLRPYSGKINLDKLKLRRIFTEMEHAAKYNKTYHLWWHPHNFGKNLNQSLQELSLILDQFAKHRKKFEFASLSMRDVTNSY